MIENEVADHQDTPVSKPFDHFPIIHRFYYNLPKK